MATLLMFLALVAAFAFAVKHYLSETATPSSGLFPASGIGGGAISDSPNPDESVTAMASVAPAAKLSAKKTPAKKTAAKKAPAKTPARKAPAKKTTKAQRRTK
jgi:hypothetical protein